MGNIRVLIADNEEVFREGLARLLDQQANISVVFSGVSGDEAVRAAREKHPDVVLVSGSAAQRDVAETVSEIARQAPDAKVAVITHADSGSAALKMLKAGARACLAKNITTADLVKSVELISSGRIVISPMFAEAFLEEVVSSQRVDEPKTSESSGILSQREMDVVKLIAEGNTNKEIAGTLYIAENTVKVHVKSALRKLELRNRQQLVAYAVLQRWVMLEKDDDTESRAGPQASQP
jgi:DNA-binding NarL/FixJ family response regulator